MTDTYLDLSHPITDDTPVYPGDPAVRLQPAASMADDGYRVTELALGSHTGTHVDAPSHLVADGNDLDDCDVARFVFDARLVDCTGLDPRDPIGPDALPDPGSAPAGGADLLVCHTGWDAHWGTERYRDHPYLTPAAAEHCADAGWSVGLDAPSPDPSPSAAKGEGDDLDATGESEPDGFPAHHAVLEADLLLVENLTNLDALADRDVLDGDRFTLYAFPLSLADADGAPVRAVADPNPVR